MNLPTNEIANYLHNWNSLLVFSFFLYANMNFNMNLKAFKSNAVLYGTIQSNLLITFVHIRWYQAFKDGNIALVELHCRILNGFYWLCFYTEFICFMHESCSNWLKLIIAFHISFHRHRPLSIPICLVLSFPFLHNSVRTVRILKVKQSKPCNH